MIALRNLSASTALSKANISSRGVALGRRPLPSRRALYQSCRVRHLSNANSAGPPSAGPSDGGEVSYMQIEKDLAAMQRSIRDLHGHSDYAGSLAVAKQALEVSRDHFGEQHPVTASLLNNIALNQKYLGDVDAAISTFKQALEIYEAVLGETHTSCATCKINIAKLLQLQANHVPGLDRMQLLQEAKEIAEEALVVKLDNLGDRNPEVGTVMFSLGAIYNDLKMHDEAVETLVEVISWILHLLGSAQIACKPLFETCSLLSSHVNKKSSTPTRICAHALFRRLPFWKADLALIIRQWQRHGTTWVTLTSKWRGLMML